MDTQALIIFVTVLLFCLVAVLVSQHLSHQQLTKTLKSLLTSQTDINSQLMNLLLSKDPMTYATLQAQTTASQNYSTYEPYSPVGTDEDEWKRQQAILGRDVTDDNAYEDDISIAFGGLG